MRVLSPRMIEAILAQESKEIFVPLLRLEHEDWVEPKLLACNGHDVVHGGQTYVACSFTLLLPDDVDATLPVVRWELDAIDLETIRLLRATIGPIEASIKGVLASQPGIVDYLLDNLTIHAVECDERSIRGTMDLDWILNEQACVLTMNPSTAEGLFG